MYRVSALWEAWYTFSPSLNEWMSTCQTERQNTPLLPREIRSLKGRANRVTAMKERNADEGKTLLDISSSGKPPRPRKKRLRVWKPGFSVPSQCGDNCLRGHRGPSIPGHAHTGFESPSLRWAFSLFPHPALLSCSWGPPATRSHCEDRAQSPQGLVGTLPVSSSELLP